MITGTTDVCKVKLQGTVISMNVTSKVSRVRVITEGEKGTTNFPEIMVFNTSLLQGVELYKKITIIAHTQNRNVRQSDGTYKPRTVIVADSIRVAPRRLLEYFDKRIIIGEDGGTVEDINEFVLIGTVLRVFEASNTTSIMKVSISDKSGNVRQCDFSCFHKQSKLANMIEIGKRVACVGFVSTDKKEVNGEVKYFQNLICRDLALINE